MRLKRRPEIVAGRCAADGTIVAGSGFTSVKSSTGVYTITVDPSFHVISATASGNNNPFMTVIGQWSSNQFQVFMYNSASALTDQQFSFIAVGIPV